ncbi:WD repeat-containing protein 4 [Kappamyces sp. JEL0680]|nr:WD repeat-containing protein 4 [Kappamyces sp. JEL0680]
MTFNVLLRLPATDRVFVASDSHVFFLDSSTGSVLASSHPQANAPILISRDSLPKAHVRVAAYHQASGQIAFAADDKEVQVWDTKTYKRIASAKSFKRAMSLGFSLDGKRLFLGDRAGDLYAFSIATGLGDPKLLLGAVSILTDFVFTSDEKFLITSDRDEKIRINHYPQVFDIEHFCLGHQQYVSKLLHIPHTDLFVSGGGDEHLFVWNYKTGKLLKTLDLVPQERGELKPEVASLEYHPKTKLIAVVLLGFKGVVLFNAAKPSDIVFHSIARLDSEPHRACFDDRGNIWTLTNATDASVVVLLAQENYRSAPTSELVAAINQEALASEGTSTFDPREISKMRKWSQWNPLEGKKPQKRKESQLKPDKNPKAARVE